MEIFTREIGNMICFRVMESILAKMDICMREIGMRVKSKEKEPKSGRTNKFM
jgi:hypothetical protein